MTEEVELEADGDTVVALVADGHTVVEAAVDYVAAA